MAHDKRHDNLTRGDARALRAINRKPLPPGYRTTKAVRFTLPEALAERFEVMTKAERDAVMTDALASLP